MRREHKRLSRGIRWCATDADDDRQAHVTVIPTLIGVIIVTFLLTRVLPGDPAVYFAGPAATPQSIAEIRKSLGLDQPLPEQFCITSTISRTAISAIRSRPASR